MKKYVVLYFAQGTIKMKTGRDRDQATDFLIGGTPILPPDLQSPKVMQAASLQLLTCTTTRKVLHCVY